VNNIKGFPNRKEERAYTIATDGKAVAAGIYGPSYISSLQPYTYMVYFLGYQEEYKVVATRIYGAKT